MAWIDPVFNPEAVEADRIYEENRQKLLAAGYTDRQIIGGLTDFAENNGIGRLAEIFTGGVVDPGTVPAAAADLITSAGSGTDPAPVIIVSNETQKPAVSGVGNYNPADYTPKNNGSATADEIGGYIIIGLLGIVLLDRFSRGGKNAKR